MKKHFLIFICTAAFLFFSPDQLFALTAGNGAVSSYDYLTSQDFNAGGNLRLYLEHASIGENIKDGLDDLGHSWRQNWDFNNRANPNCNDKISGFESRANSRAGSYDVLTMKLCFVDTPGQVNCPGYTAQELWSLYKEAMDDLEAGHLGKDFVWWTIPLKTYGDHGARQEFNNLVRSYVGQRNKILFDIAAIESDGGRCSSGGNETLCSNYTNDGGHLDSTGRVRVAKALWWLMAQIAGGGGPTSTPGPTATPRPTSPPTSTPQPTSTLPPGQINLALNKPVQTDNEYYSPAVNLVDGVWGQIEGHWAGRGSGHWVKIDLGADYQIERIRLGPYGRGGSNTYYYNNAWNIRYAASTNPDIFHHFSGVNKLAGAGSLTGSGIRVTNGDPGTSSSRDDYKYYDFSFNPVNARYIRYQVTDGDSDGDSNGDELEVYGSDQPDGCLPGDADDNGQVNDQDIKFVLANYFNGPVSCADQNNDNLINSFDFAKVVENL